MDALPRRGPDARRAATSQVAALRRLRMRSVAEQPVDERLRLERREIVRSLPQPHELDGHTELTLDRDDDAALRGAVELREDDARDSRDLTEDTRLHEPVLARRRVEDEKDLAQRGLLLDDTADLAELVH